VEKCKTEKNQSSSITWPIRLWLLWGIVLWKESLCKIWRVFILIKCICFRIKKIMCEVVSKTLLFPPKKPIVFPKNPLFSNMCTFLSHCFETKNYHCTYPIPIHKVTVCQSSHINNMNLIITGSLYLLITLQSKPLFDRSSIGCICVVWHFLF